MNKKINKSFREVQVNSQRNLQLGRLSMMPNKIKDEKEKANERSKMLRNKLHKTFRLIFLLTFFEKVFKRNKSITFE